LKSLFSPLFDVTLYLRWPVITAVTDHLST